jgi:hypothetical protein
VADLARRHQPDPGASGDVSPAAASPHAVEFAKAHPTGHHDSRKPIPHGPKKHHGPQKHHAPKLHHAPNMPVSPPVLPPLPPVTIGPAPPLTVTITGHVSGNIAFLKNGIPTVAPGPIANAGVVVTGYTDANGTTDQQGNFTLSLQVLPGESIGVYVVALGYISGAKIIPFSMATAVSISITLPDDPLIVDHRMPLFDGTGDGAVDQAGNEYHYLGHGEYYATIGGQTEYFTPQFDNERYYCAALNLFYYASDIEGTYGLNGGFFTLARGEERLAIYESVGGSVYVNINEPSSYFKPLA